MQLRCLTNGNSRQFRKISKAYSDGCSQACNESRQACSTNLHLEFRALHGRCSKCMTVLNLRDPTYWWSSVSFPLLKVAFVPRFQSFRKSDPVLTSVSFGPSDDIKAQDHSRSASSMVNLAKVNPDSFEDWILLSPHFIRSREIGTTWDIPLASLIRTWRMNDGRGQADYRRNDRDKGIKSTLTNSDTEDHIIESKRWHAIHKMKSRVARLRLLMILYVPNVQPLQHLYSHSS